MTSEIMAVARNNQFFKIFLHGVPRRNFRFDLRKKTVLLLAEICAHSKASNARGKLRRSEAEGTNRRSLLASA